jgi:LPS-assembly protein
MACTGMTLDRKRKSLVQPSYGNMIIPLRLAALFALFVLAPATVMPALSNSGENGPEQVRTEIVYRDGTVTLISDFQEKIASLHRAEGRVRITFQDMIITGEEAGYDEVSRKGYIEGRVHFSQKEQWLSSSRAEFDFLTQTGTFHEASGFTDREFIISGEMIVKTGPDTYRVEDGSATTCDEDCPKWSFNAARTDIRIDRTARMRHTVFKIKQIPVFYTPYLILPIGKKERSSGFVPFHTGTSTSKGRVFSEGYYQTLGESADLLLYGDYFTSRGLALGGTFRARPNPATHFSMQLYGLRDKLDQGGVQIIVDGESQLSENWRAVVKANTTTNFAFRQVFSENLRAATVSTEKATGFLTHNSGSMSTNISFDRKEVLFPTRSMVVRNLPSLEFNSLGLPLGKSPFILDFRTSVDGLSRVDSLIETARVVQRFDVFPRITMLLPSFGGFSFIPTLGARQTYYGAHLSDDVPSGVMNRGLHRRYLDLSIEMRTPVLERNFSSSSFGTILHAVEPRVTYRRIHGINDLEKTIRFDYEDAVANTNEIEYGIVNRFYRERQSGAKNGQKQEFMSLSLIQKFYFDPTFGGAFKPGRMNAFHPLDSVTGFYQTGVSGNLSPVSAIVQFNPRRGISNDIRVDFDPRLNQLRNTSLTTSWRQNDFIVSGTYFNIHQREEGFPTGEHLQGQIGYGSPAKGLSSSMTASYNLRSGQWLNSNTRVQYTWDCLGIGVEITQYALGLRRETRFSFSFALKGIGNFGTMRRPESLF